MKATAKANEPRMTRMTQMGANGIRRPAAAEGIRLRQGYGGQGTGRRFFWFFSLGEQRKERLSLASGFAIDASPDKPP
ncbi:MAG: hypothetical protein ABIL58_07545 [Pseudomonadota bacterium]